MARRRAARGVAAGVSRTSCLHHWRDLVTGLLPCSLQKCSRRQGRRRARRGRAPLVGRQALRAAVRGVAAGRVVQVGRAQLLHLDGAACLVVHDVAALDGDHLAAPTARTAGRAALKHCRGPAAVGCDSARLCRRMRVGDHDAAIAAPPGPVLWLATRRRWKRRTRRVSSAQRPAGTPALTPKLDRDPGRARARPAGARPRPI